MSRRPIPVPARLRAWAVAAILVVTAVALAAPAEGVDPPPVPRPGGSVGWSPGSRQALGRPVLFTGSANGAFVAWMDPQLTRPVVVPGTGDPLGSPWGGQVAPDQRPFLVSSFNGGFKWGDFDGGVIAFGASYRSPVAGEGSLIVYDDGSYNVGAWGRDNDPNKHVVALRQNLGMLVDGGAPTPAASNPGAWGASVAGVATARSAVGVDGQGALVWAGGRAQPARSRQRVDRGRRGAGHADGHQSRLGELQQLRRRARQRRARQRDLRRDRRRPLPPPHGRDFVAVFVRGTVVPGATAKLGANPLAAQVKVK